MIESTTIAERTRMLIDSQHLNEYSFSKKIGKSNSAVQKIVKGESKPGFDMLEAIFQEFPTLNREWYIEGKGEMFRPEITQAESKQDQYLQDYMNRLEERFIKMIEARDQQIISLTRMLEQALGKPEVVLAYAASCALFFLSFGYNFGYNPLTTKVNRL
ncbi:helix-turn-helix domain-containing protein [Larkinella bovis]|uniref:Helix-turn-helix domain-containing protein n=1 Tax=Larkinella bovis TaxID=683041 RepID=A0ABW0IKV4_9BACT